MANLGSFGAAAREYEADDRELDTFEFCGETFTVVGEIPPFLELKFAAALAGKVDGLDGDAVLYEALQFALTVPARTVDGKPVPADASQWNRFSRAAPQLEDGEWFTALVMTILAAQAGRPTRRRSGSSAGSSPTSPSSSSSSSPSPDSPDSAPAAVVSAG